MFAGLPQSAIDQIDQFPLLAPPPGVTPDFVHPVWHGRSVVIASAVGIPLMIFMSSVRIYCKIRLRKAWILDDYIFLVSLVAALVLISLQVALVTGGVFGYHGWDILLGRLTKPVMVRAFVLDIISGPLTWFIKLALFSLIYHAFNPLTYIRWLVYVGLILSGLIYIATAAVSGAGCGPRGGYDRLSYIAGLASTECRSPRHLVEIFDLVSGILNSVVDLYLLVIPMRAISQLNLPRKRKLGVYLIFLTGGGACVMSTLGLYYRARTFAGSRDPTYEIMPLLTVSTLEYTVGILIPCMATFSSVFSDVSHYLKSYARARFGKSRRIDSIQDSAKESSIEINYVQQKKVMPDGQPVSQVDTIDRMLMTIPPWSVKGEDGQAGRSTLEPNHGDESSGL